MRGEFPHVMKCDWKGVSGGWPPPGCGIVAVWTRGGNRGLGWDFFVSYTQADRAWAVWVAWVLEEAGYRVLVQAWDFVPGGNWTHGCRPGERAARTIAVLSRSTWSRSTAAPNGGPRGPATRPARSGSCCPSGAGSAPGRGCWRA